MFKSQKRRHSGFSQAMQDSESKRRSPQQCANPLWTRLSQKHPGVQAKRTNATNSGDNATSINKNQRSLSGYLAEFQQGNKMYQGLASAFGPEVDNIGVIASDAAHLPTPYERGGAIHLGGSWNADASDSQAMEILGHETAHALAPHNNYSNTINSPSGSHAEGAARESGSGFAAFAGTGFASKAPRLSAAPRAAGTINHFESDEHRRSVDWSSELLELSILNARPESELTEDQISRRDELRVLHFTRNQIAGYTSTLPSDLDPDDTQQLLDASSSHLSRTIRLGNGMEVTPGDITALMGDFYGRLDGESLLVEGSMRDLNYGDATEMQALLGAFDRERAGEHVGTGEFEGITADRRDMSYLELAEVNSAHFSSADATGTDNNMGAYQAFHDRALESAATGDRNQAYIYESMAMHYLTDRHAAGHSFDKRGIMNAVEGSGDLTGNMRVKGWHDLLNEGGAAATNAQGGSWTTYGDANWDASDNAENRIRTAVSVATSWAEIDTVLADPAALEATRSAHGAQATVPAFSQARQDRFENFDESWGTAGGIFSTISNVDQLPGAAWGKTQRAYGETRNWVYDTVDEVERGVNTALDWRTWYYGLGGR
ncbi:MAG: hypothetical protein GY770_13220 [Aestuariibacter sp.]|nr:hypothetical protein [Aestuariibacter sp.]